MRCHILTIQRGQLCGLTFDVRCGCGFLLLNLPPWAAGAKAAEHLTQTENEADAEDQL